ncbi:MAG: cryptochrome/photolyase family protein, partial [Gemmatimonadetes bacterium]|nr:cryptochrome/photolyase family protein [Gemmatimonadota bacterium]
MRHLVVVLGDQLDDRSAAFDGFDPSRDRVWMAEVPAESTHVWSHQARIALFLAAMRHFARSLDARGFSVLYRSLEDAPPDADLGSELATTLREHRPERVILTEPGEHRVEVVLREATLRAGVPLEVRDDRHFYCSRERFARHRRGRKQLRLEYFYREMRREHGVLLDDGAPVGGAWNYDAENRKAFPRSGPGEVPRPLAFPPDGITRDVLDLVARRFGSHPGSLEAFDWPVTSADAERALEDFLRNRLPRFGDTQDAMWTNEPVLYHSRLSAALNLKLLDPRDVVSRAEREYRAGRAPLAAVEGFIRQILGWREFVRGVYWSFMPEYVDRNALDAHEPLPAFYWTAETDLNCLHQALAQTLATGYAHHIQRLMVTGLFALLLGVDPREVHRWYLAIYVDAVEWVELPNT